MFNILLVDDEIKITQVVKAYLDKEGYNTFVAHDGKKALELFNLKLDEKLINKSILDLVYEPERGKYTDILKSLNENDTDKKIIYTKYRKVLFILYILLIYIKITKNS